MIRRIVRLVPVLAILAVLAGCNSTVPVADVSISIDPGTATVTAGQMMQFTANVAHSVDTAVMWSVVGGATNGTITVSGQYMAPSVVPNPAKVTIQATSVADSTKVATATVTITSNVAVSVTPVSADVAAGGTQQFSATVTGATDTSVTWSVEGGATNGTIDANGLYTAPATAPNPATVTVTAKANADANKSASARVTVTTPVAVSVKPAIASVLVNATQQFSATVTGSADTAVVWTLAGSGCAGATCGSVDASGLYTAPATAPKPATVTLTATAHADVTAMATATITITASNAVTVAVSPKTASLAPGKTQQFQAQINDPSNAGVAWSVSGSTCTGSACGTITQAGLYTAPATQPTGAVANGITGSGSQQASDPTVTVTATSLADQTVTDTATVTLTAAAAPPQLNGSYVMEFPSAYLKVLAHFSADGNGNISGGIADDHTGQGPHHFTGTYTVGADGRGTMNLTYSDNGLQALPTMWKFVLDSDGNGWVESFSTTVAGRATHGGGRLMKQQTGAFATPSGTFVFTAYYSGDTSRAVLGRMVVNNGQATGNWEIEDGRSDPAAWIPETISAGFSDPANLTASTGRVLFTLHSPIIGDIPSVAYMYSATEGFIETIDGGSQMNGVMKAQANTTFSNASWNGTGIFRLTQFSSGWAGVEYGMGAITADGQGNLTATVDYGSGDNSHYSYIGSAQCQGTNTAIGADGHGSLVMTCTGVGGIGAAATFYMLDQNTALVIGGTSAHPTSKTGTGTLEPQTGGPFGLSWQGSYAMGYDVMADYNDAYPIGMLSFDGAGAISGTGDENDTKGRQITDISFAGAYTMNSTGEGTYNIGGPYFTIGGSPAPGQIWIVSPKKAYLGMYVLTGQ